KRLKDGSASSLLTKCSPVVFSSLTVKSAFSSVFFLHPIKRIEKMIGILYDLNAAFTICAVLLFFWT
ncbi:MAG: hypothetical protein EBU80_06465, partial [Chitinophagia bacterium]|nr:hypothetical protein [Chitinophagia bacterium]